MSGRVALGALQKRRVQDDGVAALQRRRGLLADPRIGGGRHARAVEHGRVLCVAAIDRLQARQALAFDIGPDADGADGFKQALSQRGFAAARKPVRQHQHRG